MKGYKQKKCIVCGKNVNRKKFLKFCSNICREKHIKKRTKGYRQKQKDNNKKYHKCIVCGKNVNREEFYKFCSEECRKTKRKEIEKKGSKKYYQQEDIQRIFTTIRTLINKPLANLVKEEVGCMLCGNKNLSNTELDFHHIKTKKGKISSLIQSSTSIRLLEEIEKCQVLCSNCHRKIHDNEGIVAKIANETRLI